ncbi:MAG: PH domain-containing protein [Phycisphaerales bacterium JB065]
MNEERILVEASFTPEAIKYHTMSATLGAGALFIVIGALLAIPTVGFSLILLLVPVGIWLVAQWYYQLYFDKLSCILTDRKLKISKGLLFRTEKAIPLDKITDMQMNQGPLMRYLDLESMRVETAGSAGASGGALVSLVGIRDSREFREAVLAQRDRVVGTSDKGASPQAHTEPIASQTASTPDTLAVLTEIRDTLSRIESRLDRP